VRAILLGPQRRPTLDGMVRSLGLPGPFATVTAGWQEREPDDGELRALLDGHVVLDIECLDRIYLNAYVPIL